MKSSVAGITQPISIGLIQMHSAKGEIDANLTSIEAYVREAVGRGVDLLLFPEMSITGYIDPARWPEAVLPLQSAPIRRFVAMTAGTEVTAIAGLVEVNPRGKPFITQIVARSGSLAGVYRKITVIDEEAEWFAAGAAGVTVVDDPRGPFGLAICADIENPTVFAELARAGARIVFEAAAPGLYGEQATRDWQSGFAWWRDQCRGKLAAYARQHGYAIAVATQAGRTVDEDFPGGGYLFAPDGRCLAASDDWAPGALWTTVR